MTQGNDEHEIQIRMHPPGLRRRLIDARTVWSYWKHCAPQREAGLIDRIRATVHFARILRKYERCKIDSEELFKAPR